MTVEFFFYALFPFFTMWAYRQSTKKLILVSVVLWVVTQVIHNILWVGYYPDEGNFLIYFPLFHLSSFILGAVGGIWFLREGRDRAITSRTSLSVLLGSVLLVSVYIILSSKNSSASQWHGINDRAFSTASGRHHYRSCIGQIPPFKYL